MRSRTCFSLFLLTILLFCDSYTALATVFSSLRGVIHDAQHFPIQGAKVTVHAANSDFQLTATTGASGEFDLSSVPLGVYRVHVEAAGFEGEEIGRAHV